MSSIGLTSGVSFGNSECMPTDMIYSSSAYMNSAFGDGFVSLDPNKFMFEYIRYRQNMPSNDSWSCGNGFWSGVCRLFINPLGLRGGGISWTPSVPNSYVSSTTYSSPEEAKYKKLYDLVSTYANNRFEKYQNDTLKKQVDEINKSKDPYTDKYTKLENIYKNNKNDIDKFMLEETGDGLNVGNLRMGTLSIETGYRTYTEYKNHAENLVKNATNDNAVDTTKPILGLLSSYNDGTRNLIKDLYKNANNPYALFKIETLRDMLVEEAEKYAKNLNPKNNEYNQMITDLKNASVNDKDAFTPKFNKLYAYTRIIAAKVAGNMINTHYPAVGADVMIAETKKDLLQEKVIDETNITSAANALNIKADAVIGEKTFNTVKITDKTAEEAMELLSMPEYGQLNKLSETITIGNTQYTVYEEAYGQDKFKYIVDDGKVYKVTVNGSCGTKGEEAQAQAIQERMVDAHENYVQKQTEEQKEADKKRIEAEKNRNNNLNTGLETTCEKNLTLEYTCKGQLDTNSNKKLKNSAKTLANLAYSENQPDISEETSDKRTSYVAKIEGKEKVRIVKNKDKDTNKIYVYVNNFDVCYCYNTETDEWTVNVKNPSAKDWAWEKDTTPAKRLTFTNNIQDTLAKIFGENIEGWFSS